MSFNYGVLHLTYGEEIAKKFKQEFLNITQPARNINYKKHDIIKVIKTASKQLTYICKFLLGVTFFLNGELSDAAIICEELHNEIIRNKINQPVINYLKNNLPYRCYEINMFLAIQSYDKYNIAFDEMHLETFLIYLQKANNYLPDTYSYFLLMSIFHFIKYRDIKKARECINNCRKISENNTWRYIDAFLTVYEEQSLLTAYRKYKQAFKIQYNLLILSSFIEHILEIEPHKASLHFALGLIYDQLGDQELMQQHFNAFIINIDGFKQKDALLSLVASFIDCEITDTCLSTSKIK